MTREIDDMRRPIAAIAAATSTFCVGVALAGDSANPEANATTPDSGIDIQVPDSKDRIEEYWTRDRMRAARPMPKPIISREPDDPTAEDVGETE